MTTKEMGYEALSTRMAPQPSRSDPSARLSELRWLADSYENSQAQRIAIGERLRSLCRVNEEGMSAREADRILSAAREGADVGPSPILARAYRRSWEQEREYARAMTAVLREHPAWAWLSGVKGIGPTLGCRLLARLDILRAPTPSSFWSFCGLATVPGRLYTCSVCGERMERPVAASRPVDHRHGRTRCDGVWIHDESQPLRCAPRLVRGTSRSYDAEAKRICYLIGCSFLKCGSPYRAVYDAERRRLDRVHSPWTDLRRHYAALRKMEKQFLLDLWREWSRALGDAGPA